MRLWQLITGRGRRATSSGKRRIWRWSIISLLAIFLLQGCGLVYDAVIMLRASESDELSTICERGRLRVGISFESVRPFIFPPIYTNEDIRITGLDIELIREVTATLTSYCGGPTRIVPTLYLTPFSDLFIKMAEGELDLFVSSVGGTVPGARPTGLWFSAPYLHDDGIAAIINNPEIAERVWTQFRDQNGNSDTLAAVQRGFAGLTVAVQKGRTSELYARANLTQSRIVICDSFPPAVETNEPNIDVILSTYSILKYVTTRVWRDWHLLTQTDGSPLFLTRDPLSIVIPEEHRRLQWFVNNLLYRMEESGRLWQMRKRWIEEDYAPNRRAATEGLPLEASQVPQYQNPSRCQSPAK